MKVSDELAEFLAAYDRVVVNGTVTDDEVKVDAAFGVDDPDNPDEELKGFDIKPESVQKDAENVIKTIVTRGDPEHDDGDFGMTFTPDTTEDPDSDPQVSVEWRPHFFDGAEHDIGGEMVAVPPAHYWG